LGWDKSIIYFVTICVKERKQVLANAKTFDAIRSTIAQMQKWQILAGVIMPDRVHWIVSPIEERDRSVGDFATGFKRSLRKILGGHAWEWQRGCFDRLLRSDENLGSKWIYVQDNPERAGFVRKSEDWPYYLDFINDGKLTASPTEMQSLQNTGVRGA
jgi:REP element-mobilizing transposase RayT